MEITEKNVGQIKAPVILEAANAPISPAADQQLAERGVIVLPDVLANAGGVTVSYFEDAGGHIRRGQRLRRRDDCAAVHQHSVRMGAADIDPDPHGVFRPAKRVAK